MSTRCCTWIRIGGALASSRVEQFLQVVRNAQVGLECDVVFESADPENLLEARQDGRLWLCDSESRDGDLRGLDDVCEDLGLAYRQHIEEPCGGNPLLDDWRPGMTEPLYRTASDAEGGEILVDETAVREALTALEAGRAVEATAMLRRLCPDVPDVPPFTIV